MLIFWENPKKKNVKKQPIKIHPQRYLFIKLFFIMLSLNEISGEKIKLKKKQKSASVYKKISQILYATIKNWTNKSNPFPKKKEISYKLWWLWFNAKCYKPVAVVKQIFMNRSIWKFRARGRQTDIKNNNNNTMKYGCSADIYFFLILLFRIFFRFVYQGIKTNPFAKLRLVSEWRNEFQFSVLMTSHLNVVWLMNECMNEH